MDQISRILQLGNAKIKLYLITSHSPIELAIPAPYPLIYPFSLHAPNSSVNQYKVPNLDKSFYSAPHDNIPIS